MRLTRRERRQPSEKAEAKPHPAIAWLDAALASGSMVKTAHALQTICARPEYLAAGFSAIEEVVRRHGQLPLFEMALLDTAEKLALPAAALHNVASYARQAGFLKPLRQAVAARRAASEATSPLAELEGLTEPAAPAVLIELARRIAPKLAIDETLAQTLFQHRGAAALGWEAWERGFRFAAALETVTNHATNKQVDLGPLFHPQTAELLQAAMLDGKAALFVTAHAGFTAPRNFFLRTFLKQALAFRREGRREPYIWKKDDARTALFCGVRALAAGTPVILAPDGPLGTARTAISVLAGELTIATGGIFMAHATRSDLVWLHIEFQDGVFVPVMVREPGPAPKESLKDFNKRFLRFYESMLKGCVTGDPGNIVIPMKWATALCGQDAEAVSDA